MNVARCISCAESILMASAAFRRFSTAWPHASASLTGFTVMSAGDAAAQKHAGAPAVDMQRNLVSSSYNGLAAPVFYRWYRLMDWLIPASNFRALVPKVLFSQLVTTGGNNPCYLAWCNHLEAWAAGREAGTSIDWAKVRQQTVKQLRGELPNLYGSSMLFWLPVTAANFALLPDHLRILWVSSCSVLWGGFVSSVAHRGDPK